MDAGIAAVLGALAGAVATTGAAFATGYAAREQARIAARAARAMELRQPRHEAYARLIEAGAQTRELHRRWRDADIGDTDSEAEMLSQVSQYAMQYSNACLEVREAWKTVPLLGPPHVTEASRRVGEVNEQQIEILDEVRRQMLEYDYPHAALWGEFDEARKHFSEAFNAFVSAAELALNDDGTRRGSRGSISN